MCDKMAFRPIIAGRPTLITNQDIRIAKKEQAAKTREITGSSGTNLLEDSFR